MATRGRSARRAGSTRCCSASTRHGGVPGRRRRTSRSWCSARCSTISPRRLLAYGVAAALFQREKSGKGQYLSLSLLRSALTIQAGRFVWAESEGREVARDSGTGGLTGIHPTKQGGLYISVHSNHFFAALCELVGRPELAQRPALRLDAQPRRACRRTRAGNPRRAGRAHRARMGGDFRRARALRGGAADRGHVRPSAGRSPRSWSRRSTIRWSAAIGR